jgi:hypothetical protein
MMEVRKRKGCVGCHECDLHAPGFLARIPANGSLLLDEPDGFPYLVAARACKLELITVEEIEE